MAVWVNLYNSSICAFNVNVVKKRCVADKLRRYSNGIITIPRYRAPL